MPLVKENTNGKSAKKCSVYVFCDEWQKVLLY